MTPRPPAWAMAMAMRASVTVSMAEAMIGRLRRIERVSRVGDLDSRGQDLGAARPQQHVVEGQAFDDLIEQFGPWPTPGMRVERGSREAA